MPYPDGDPVSPPNGSEKSLKHQHSASFDQSFRALVPMWDSSDPDRAPPPLPLNPNPQSPGLTSRAGTSIAIQSAHAALSDRARENTAVARRVGESPERALVKGVSHRRLKSLQPGSVRDLSSIIEGNWSRSDLRPSTPTSPRQLPPEPRREDREPVDFTPTPGPSLTPILRPTARRPAQSILGENTPPQSSTLLALQTMGAKQSPRGPEAALAVITNGSSPTHALTSTDVAAQLITLTDIAKSLQREMSALTRRSRDNATDLLSLKEATKTRDEDVRKSLRELMGNISETSGRIASFGGNFLDDKPHGSPPTSSRAFQLPHIPSLKSFAESIDRGSISTPSLASVDASASIMLLEKIWNGLGTKDGHKSLVSLLTELSQKISGMATSAKVEELADYVRSQSESALVVGDKNRGKAISDETMELHKHSNGAMTQRVERLLQNNDTRQLPTTVGRGAEFVNEDLMKIIRSVKDSVAQGGGLTAEVKALVRELRGEVLGMGRELGKRLEKIGVKGVEEAEPPSKDEVSRVIDEGLEQMKEQLNHVLREHRRQSAQSQSSQKTAVDYREIYNAMRAALRDSEGNRAETSDLSREDVIEAVREAWENYKPEFDVQHIGLERDEVLACLREGLQEYVPRGDERPQAATRDEVFKAVVEGLKHFVPPRVETPASLSRDEVFDAVRDCLEEFEFPIAASAIGNDMSHKDVVNAVREGLNELDLPRSNALMAAPITEEIVSRLRDIMEYMKLEFRAVSEEAKENVAANGRDTEQVLDATKDGLENLRIAIEGYVDRVSGAAGHEEFMANLSRTMDEFKQEVSRVVAQTNDSSREQLQTELAGLREVVNSSMVPAVPQTVPSTNNQEILDALHSGLNSLRQEVLRPRPETSEIIDAIQDGLNDLRAGFDRVTNKPVDLTANDEILDALKAGLDSVRSDIETIRDTSTERAVAAVGVVDEDNDRAIIPVDMVKQDDIRNLEVLITQLRIKVEAMEPESDSIHREDLTRLEEILRNVQEGVEEVRTREPTVAAAAATAQIPKETTGGESHASGDVASKEDVQAIETILRNTKASLDDLIEGEQAVRKEHIDAVESLVLETRETMVVFAEQLNTVSQKEDFSALETMITQLSLTLDEMRESIYKPPADNEELATRHGVEAVEAIVLETKAALDGLAGTDFAAISNKEDVAGLELLLKEAKATIETHNEATTKALDDRQAEIVGVADRVSEAKAVLEELQTAFKAGGLDDLTKLIEGISEKVDKNENISADVKEMFETMKTQFEENKEVVAGSRLESNEKLQEAAENIASKIEESIAELMTKYDELKATLNDKDDTNEARSLETEAAVTSTKAVAEDLKLLIDTLGSTVTDSLEKMEEASKTVFSRVEDLANRTEESQAEGKTEHEQTRDRIQQAVSAVESLQGEVKEVQPQILEAVKDILLLVGEHFEHSKVSNSDLCDKIAEVKPFDQAMLPPPPEKYDDSHVQEKLSLLAEHRYDDSEVKERLDRLVEQQQQQQYDDSSVHEKLDRLVDHTATSVEALSRLETLDKVHQSVVSTAAEVSQFLSTQTQRIADEHEDREKNLQDTIIALERKLAEREHAEAAVLSLQDERSRLHASVVRLRTEQESLIRQKTRLAGDVGSLETALRLRKEELSDMEHRAERLERRILEGVMDHSRMLLMGKSGRDGNKTNMSRKRVKKDEREAAGQAKVSRPAVSMALSARRNLAAPASTENGAARRIVSLSQMESNSPSALVKRSQSVRTPAGNSALRKRSWGGGLAKGFGMDDKENLGLRETVEELDELDSVMPSPAASNTDLTAETDSMLDSAVDYDGGEASDADTMRRTSAGTTIMSSSRCTESDVSYSEYDGTVTDDWTDGGGGHEGAMVVYGGPD